MDGLTATVRASIVATATKTRDTGTLTWPLNISDSLSLTTGNGANQVNEMFDDDRTLAASANEELDLSGTLTNAFGDTIAFTGVKALYIKNNSSVDTLTVGDAAATPWEPFFGATGETLQIPPGGMLLLTAPSAGGWPVTGGSADKLKITNGAGGSTTYRIIILGDLA